MIAIDIKKVKAVQDNYIDKINAQYKNAVKRLEKIKPITINDCNYLYTTIELYKNDEKFLLKSPEEIELLIDSLPTVPLIEIKIKNEIKIVKSPIKDEILNALDYKSIRSDFYPEYFQEIGIKACVYCNSSLTVSVDRINDEGIDSVRAKFQVDHYFPKVDFPMLSISLFNLYPCCASCNNVKKDKMVKFRLYSNNENEVEFSNFQFKLSSYNEAKYLIDKQIEILDFEFIENTNLPEGYQTFQTTFDIKGIYNTQKDLISDLIDKSLVYDYYYKRSLNDNFPKLFISKEHFEKFILGNYPRVQDIHKRPMSKFMQDIARDLGLID